MEVELERVALTLTCMQVVQLPCNYPGYDKLQLPWLRQAASGTTIVATTSCKWHNYRGYDKLQVAQLPWLRHAASGAALAKTSCM